MQRLIAMRTNVCSHLGRGVRGGCERSRQTEGQPGVSQREVLRDVCRAAESRREAPAWSGIFGSNARGSSCGTRSASGYGDPAVESPRKTRPRAVLLDVGVAAPTPACARSSRCGAPYTRHEGSCLSAPQFDPMCMRCELRASLRRHLRASRRCSSTALPWAGSLAAAWRSFQFKLHKCAI